MPDVLDDLLRDVPAKSTRAPQRPAAPSSFDLERDAQKIKDAYRSQFNAELPISAFGQTEFHRKLGRDHSADMDVGLDPTSKAGQWLTSYLSSQNIPFIPQYHAGQLSSGPHIHVGFQSRKLDALDYALDEVPAASSSAPAGDALDKLLADVPASDSDSIGTVNAKPALAPPKSAPQTFDPYDPFQRARRDAVAQAELQPNARKVIDLQLPAGVRDWTLVSGNDAAQQAVRQHAAEQGIDPKFTEEWLKQHGAQLKLYDLSTGANIEPADAIGTPSYDSDRRTFRVNAEMPYLKQFENDYQAWRSPAQHAADWLNDPTRTAGEKAGDVVSAGAHALDVVTRPLQAASTVVAGEQRNAGALLAAPFSQGARDVLKSGIYSPETQIAAALHKLKTGETPEGYEQPVAEGLDLLSQLYRKEPLNPIVKEAVALGFDPVNYAPLEGLNEAGARVLSAPARIASRLAEDLPDSRLITRASRALSDLRDPRVEELFNSGGRVLDLRATPKDADHFFVTVEAGDGAMVRVDTRTGEFEDLGAQPHHSNFQPREEAGTFKPGSPSMPVDRGQPLPDYIAEMAGRQPGGDELDKLLADVPLARPSLPSRVALTVSDAVNLPKSVKNAFALHGPFRQGVFQAAAHPSFLKDALVTQAKAFASEDAYQSIVASIMSRPDFQLMKDSGLFLPSVRDVEFAGEAPRFMREEAFASRTAERLPGVRRSSRAYSAAMDSLRVQAWDAYLADPLIAKNANVDGDTYKALADLINVTTGRGTVAGLDRSQLGRRIVTALNNPLWSPRAMAARFNQISPYRIAVNALDPATRPVAALQLKDSMRALSTVGATMALLSQVPGVKVGLNPYKADWGKVVIGNTRYDLVDGVPATARYVAQMSRAFYAQAKGGELKRGQDSPLSLTQDFLRRRLSPAGQVAADAYTGRTLEGEPFTKSQAARDLAAPFIVDGLYQAWLDAGGSSVTDAIEGQPVKTAFKGSLKGLPSVIGIPASTYKSRVPQRKDVGATVEP